MIKVIILLLVTILFNTYGISQINTNYNDCGILNNIRFKSDRDTFHLNAKYLSLGKIANDTLLRVLSRKKKLKLKDFWYAIEFQAINCSTKFYMPCRYQKVEFAKKFLEMKNIGKPIYLTCIIFKGYTKFCGMPFFIIDKVKFE